MTIQHKKIGILILFVGFVFISSATAQTDVNRGKKLFNSNCAACHRLNKKLIGPALANISEKRSKDWTLAFIKDSQKMVKAGDVEAVKVYKEYKNVPMQSYKYIKDEDILNIIAYLDSATKKK